MGLCKLKDNSPKHFKKIHHSKKSSLHGLAAMLPFVQNLPSPEPLKRPTFHRLPWRRKHFDRSPYIFPSSHFLTLYFLSGCQRNAGSGCCFSDPRSSFWQTWHREALVPISAPQLPAPRSVRRLFPQCTCPLPSLSLFLSLSLTRRHFLSLSNWMEGEKPLSLLPTLIENPFFRQNCLLSFVKV